MGQIGFNGTLAGQSGQMHEDTFNVALARALRERRKVWRDDENAVQCERLQSLVGERARRPDIIVQSPDSYPVLIETEFGDPAIDDATKRLGKLTNRTMLPIRSAIAVGVDREVRGWSDQELERRLTLAGGVNMRFVWVSANIADGTEVDEVLDVYRWPTSGWVTGDVFELADLCDAATAPPKLVEEQIEHVTHYIRGFALTLKECLDDEVAREVAINLGQGSVDQGLRLACCIWMTSWRMHDQLAATDELRSRGLRTISEMRSLFGSPITLSAIRDAWSTILEYNYRSIFHPALAALHHRMPSLNGAEVLDGLSLLAERVTATRLGNSVDFAGELFPKLLDDRENTAAFYTLPPSAELLARLAVNRLELSDWKSAQEVAELKIADLACGTGTLLRAAYAKIRSKHDSARGDAVGLHRSMMEKSITGLDINVLATHMTSAGLSSVEVSIPHDDSNVGSVSLMGGRTGSLELLEREEVVDVTGEGVRLSNGSSREGRFISVPHGSQDLVIQNPPYTRAHSGRGVFSVAGTTTTQRQHSSARLAKLVATLKRNGVRTPNGQAGLGTHFSALANMKLKDGGVFGTVLPLTAAHAESWQGFREDMISGYENVTAITVTSDADFGFSADTDINEMLLISNKRADIPDEQRPGQVLCVNLREKPSTVVEATYVARSIEDLEDAPGDDGLLILGQRVTGSWVRLKLMRPGFPWFALGLRNQNLSLVFSKLLRSRLYGLEMTPSVELGVEMGCLEDVVDIGPTHHLIGHVRGHEPIGAFTLDAAMNADVTPFPALWSAIRTTQNTLVLGETHYGTPHRGQNDSADRARQKRESMLDARGQLFISRNLRMTSQALAGAVTEEPCLGGNAWTALASPDRGVRLALALWLNGTLGLVTRSGYGQSTQRGRSLMKIKALGGLPVPRFADDTTGAKHARDVATREFDRLAGQVLEPASYSWRDPVRREIDDVVLEMLNVDSPDGRRSMDQIRRIWCREPSVHGGNRKILKALQLAR